MVKNQDSINVPEMGADKQIQIVLTNKYFIIIICSK
jgi:hypothetical protein